MWIKHYKIVNTNFEIYNFTKILNVIINEHITQRWHWIILFTCLVNMKLVYKGNSLLIFLNDLKCEISKEKNINKIMPYI